MTAAPSPMPQQKFPPVPPPQPQGSPSDLSLDMRMAISPVPASRPRSAPLRGMSLGLVCAQAQAPAAGLFREAAEDLGAQVTVLDPARITGDVAMDGVGRLLGRLYGAIECQGLAPALVRQLAEATSVPVFDGLAAGAAPETGAERDRQLRAVQAALLAALR